MRKISARPVPLTTGLAGSHNLTICLLDGFSRFASHGAGDSAE